jgi:hypothetical protein
MKTERFCHRVVSGFNLRHKKHRLWQALIRDQALQT